VSMFYIYAVNSSSFLQWDASAIDSLPTGQNKACGYNHATKKVTILTTGTFYTYDTVTETIVNESLNDTVLISCKGQCYTQALDTIFFISDYLLGTFNMTTSTLQYPMSANALFDVYGIRACVTASEDGKFVYVAGGAVIDSSMDSARRFFRIYDVDSDVVTEGPLLPHVTAKDGTTGCTGNKWSCGKTKAAACSLYGDELFVIGGQNDEAQKFDEVRRINLTELRRMQAPSSGARCRTNCKRGAICYAHSCSKTPFSRPV